MMISREAVKAVKTELKTAKHDDLHAAVRRLVREVDELLAKHERDKQARREGMIRAGNFGYTENPIDYRAVVKLRRQGKTYREIAETLGCSFGGVSKVIAKKGLTKKKT